MKTLRQPYRNASTAHWYKVWAAHTVHPNLKINFFETINTKEIAYWLGFLYADGYMIRNKKSAEIRLKLKIRDEYTIDKFCDALQLNKSKKEYPTDEAGHRQAMIRFTCMKVGNDLIGRGLKFRKSKTIEYPELPRTNLELAFLLGYFDGDGRRNTTMISSGSERFLRQIKKRFDLPYKIRMDKREKEIYGRKINGTNYMMFLGAQLFNKMMKNYTNSMPRKRWSPCERKESIRRANKASRREEVRGRMILQRDWRMATKEDLERLVGEMPLKQIAARHNISKTDNVSRKCKKYGIHVPERGFWTKVYWARVKCRETNGERNERLPGSG